MMRYYCTLFDKGYLNKGLALHLSLVKHSSGPFRHFILCLDDTTYDILSRLQLPSASLIRIDEFEDDELRAVKASRTIKEYYWSLSPSLPTYVLKKHPEIDMITYLDSDLFFFSSPEPIFQAFGDSSVLIIPHNLPPGKKQKEKDVGAFNVGLLIFRNDTDGRACLEWWRQRCNEWCYEIVEPTRFGDQKYLDYFPEKFRGVKILTHHGADLAGWNIKNFEGKIAQKGGQIMIDGDPLIFFHFSSFQIYDPPSRWLPDGPAGNYHYFQPGIKKQLIYQPYTKAIQEAVKLIRTVDPQFSHGAVPRPGLLQQIQAIPLRYAKDLIRCLLHLQRRVR